jgi:hypothetical protein
MSINDGSGRAGMVLFGSRAVAAHSSEDSGVTPELVCPEPSTALPTDDGHHMNRRRL